MCFFLVKSSNVAWLLTMPLAKCIFKLFLFCCCCCCYFPLFLFFGHTVGQLGSQFPDQGSNSHPLQWKRGVLTAGPLQKSLNCFCVVFKNTNSRAISLIKVCLRIWKKRLYFFFFLPRGLWDISSPRRDRNWALEAKVLGPNH